MKNPLLKTLIVFLFLSALSALTSCEKPVDVTVENVTIDKTTLTLEVGASAKLSATVLPDNAADHKVEWSSSDPAKVVVDNNGIVVAMTVGTATVTAMAGGKSATCEITVTTKPVPVVRVTLDEKNLQLRIGERRTLKATVIPDDATDRAVTWSSSHPAIATVSKDGEVTAISAGTTAITAGAGDKSAECAVIVLGDSPNSGQTGPLAWELTDDGTLLISGHGAMPDYSFDSSFTQTDIPWYKLRNEILTIVIGEGVTSIGEYAFSRCSAFLEITMPGSLTRIGKYAFWDCRGMEEVAIGERVTALEEGVFYYCTNLRRAALPANLTSIGKSAFFECNRLCEVNFPDGIESIGMYAFRNTAITSVSLKNTTTLGEGAFYICETLTEAAFETGLTDIGVWCFMGCTSLKSVSLPETMRQLGMYAFRDCSSLQKITCKATAPPVVVTGLGRDNIDQLLVPASSVAAYQADSKWASSFISVEAIQ